MQRINDEVYYENIYPGVTVGAIILPQGTLLVDAPLRSEDARAWLNQLYMMGSKTNRMLVNQDAHPDRTLGARSMECAIIAHQKTAQVFRGRPSIFKGQNAESGSEWETYEDMLGTRWAMPDITFTNRLTIHWGGPEITIEHHPGAAPGGTWVVVPAAEVVFVGDVVLPNQPLFLTNADIPAWIATLDVLLKYFKGYSIISGRGGVVPVELVVQQQKHLKRILRGLERLARRNAPVTAVEGLIPSLLKDLTYAPDLEDLYVQRYSHGLAQYYGRRYRPSEFTSD